MASAAHTNTLAQLHAHPISRNLEWVKLIPALESVGTLERENNGRYQFARNGRTLSLVQPHEKIVSEEVIVQLRHFLKESDPAAEPVEGLGDAVLAITHTWAIVCTSPGTPKEALQKLHPDDSMLATQKAANTGAQPHGSITSEETEFYNAVAEALRPATRIAVLGHGHGNGNASGRFMELLRAEYADIAALVVSESTVDLEALSEGELVKAGIKALGR